MKWKMKNRFNLLTKSEVSMSEVENKKDATIALLEAQVKSKDNELTQCKNTIRSLSGNVGALTQLTNEFLQANIHLRSSNILLDDDARKYNVEKNSLLERINVLEKEKESVNAAKCDPKLSAVNGK